MVKKELPTDMELRETLASVFSRSERHADAEKVLRCAMWDPATLDIVIRAMRKVHQNKITWPKDRRNYQDEE